MRTDPRAEARDAVVFAAHGLGLADETCWVLADAAFDAVPTPPERLMRAVAVADRVLARLEEWDMLSLDNDGRGAATSDAPFFRDLIASARAIFADLGF